MMLDIAATVGRVLREFTQNLGFATRSFFSILASSFTELELASGHYPQQDDCIRFVRRLKYVPITNAIRTLAEELLTADILPQSKPGDALQLALAAAHRIDYLLTWNYAHLANPLTQARTGRLLRKRNLREPLMVSPESIPQARFHQTIRRPSDD